MAAFCLNGDGAEIRLLPVTWRFSGWLSDDEPPGFPEHKEGNDDMKLRSISLISAASFLLISLVVFPA
jgi:hypothetical protein